MMNNKPKLLLSIELETLFPIPPMNSSEEIMQEQIKNKLRWEAKKCAYLIEQRLEAFMNQEVPELDIK